MAVTFVVGGSDDPTANSYADISEWRSFFNDEGVDGTDLTAVADDVLKRHLIDATRFVDQLPWSGIAKYVDDVARLGLPRLSHVVGEGNPHYRPGHTLPSDSVPWVVKRAVVILAEEQRASGKKLNRPLQSRPDILKSKLSIVGSRKTYADPLGARRYPEAMQLLTGLYETASVAGLQAVAT